MRFCAAVYYYPARGRAEQLRLVFAEAEVDFEDKVSFAVYDFATFVREHTLIFSLRLSPPVLRHGK